MFAFQTSPVHVRKPLSKPPREAVFAALSSLCAADLTPWLFRTRKSANHGLPVRLRNLRNLKQLVAVTSTVTKIDPHRDWVYFGTSQRWLFLVLIAASSNAWCIIHQRIEEHKGSAVGNHPRHQHDMEADDIRESSKKCQNNFRNVFY